MSRAKFHFWTDEEKKYLKEIKDRRKYEEIAILMSEKFNMEYTRTQIQGALKRYKMSNGLDRTFKKGNIPWNYGTKGIAKPNITSFKPGHKPLNYREIGTERVQKDGYIEVKVESGKWILKQRLKYKEYHGKIPKDHVILFANKNKTDFRKENLIAVSKNKLKTMNKYKLIKENIEETKTGAIIADLIIKTQELKNNNNLRWEEYLIKI